jgi:hypothetical protein
MLTHTDYSMVDAMPIIHALFWGRRTADDAEVQAELVQCRLKSGLQRDENDGLLRNCVRLLCFQLNCLDDTSETEIENSEDRFYEIERGSALIPYTNDDDGLFSFL